MLYTLRRLTALFLALILCLTPLSALAEGETDTGPQEETVTYAGPEDVDGGVSVYADGTDSKWREVRDVTQTRDEYAGVSINTNDRSAVEVTANNVTTSGELSYGVQVSTGGESGAYVATSTVTTTGDRSVGVKVDAFDTSVVTMGAGAINTSGETSHGAVVIAEDTSTVEVRTRSVTTAGTYSDGVRVYAFGSEPTTVTVKGDVDAAYAGINVGGSGGQAIVTVTGTVTGGKEGVNAHVNHEGSSSTIIVGNTNDAGAFTGGAVTGGDTGIVVDVGSGGHAQVRTGDVEGGTTGVSAFPFSTGGTADVLIDGTLSAGNQAVTVNESTTEDDLSLTVWKVEQAGAGAALVSGSGTGENAFTDASIQYIVRTDQGPRFEGQPVGSLSAAKDAEGTMLDTAASGETTCGVAREGDKVYLSMEYDTDKYEVIGAYVDEEKKIEAQKDEDGRFFTEVSKGGGVLLSASLMEKHDHTPGAPVREELNFIPGLYDMVTYCTVCGKELSRTAHVDINVSNPEPKQNAYDEFAVRQYYRILKAPENGTVEIEASAWYGFSRLILEALQTRPDVTALVTCRLNGALTELTVPPGFDLFTPLGEGRMLYFDRLAELLG